MLDILIDSIKDTWLMLPLLFITYCVIEVFERKQNQSEDDRLFFAFQRFGPLVGALVGLIPQCGFSVLAAMLFVQRNITLGTLIAVMIATSDEAIPILLSNPHLFDTLIYVLLFKFGLGLIVGYLVDFIFHNQKIIRFEEIPEEELDEEEEIEEGSSYSCPCCYTEYPLWLSSLLRSLKIFGFLFVTTLVLNAVIEGLGEDFLRTILLNDTIFQPVLASIIGFIPNCAATVILAQLFSTGSITFGSLLAGLITNSGLGLLVLIRYQEKKRVILRVVTILCITAVLVGILLQSLAF